MGLFSRKEAKSTRQSTQRPRPSVSSEAQAASLRVRARRRLAGAVALVLAAVIVLPMLLEGEPRPIPAGIEIAVPERNSAFNPDLIAAPSLAPEQTADHAVAEPIEPAQPAIDKPLDGASTTAADQAPPASAAAPPAPPATAPAASSTASSSPSATPTRPAPSATPQTDDKTELAMAILEGRATTGAASPPPAGGFVVQVASYGSSADAQARRDKLRSEGVSNAYVEPATVNGKQTFRLRVGPFDSRSAADAAQARLRTLGYDSGFITSK